MRRRLAVLVLALVAIATPALAHVKVTPSEAERGSTATFTFTVPNEEAPAKTVKVEIFLPVGEPFATVDPGEVVGWTAKATNTTDNATSIAWTGGAIAGSDKVAFPVTLGPIPSSGDSMVFKVLQTYDNGEVARWIDVQTGTEEPPHPAPAVKLTGVAPTVVEVEVTSPPTTAAAAANDDDTSSLPLVLVLGATFLAAVGAGIGVAFWRRRTT